MSIDPRSPVLVGVGQHCQRVDEGADELEPIALLELAARAADDDAGGGVLDAVQSVRVVSLLSWRYPDPGRLVADRLGLGADVETAVTTMGGNSPQALVNTTASAIVRGELDCALLVGGEAWRTRQRYRRTGDKPDWTVLDESTPLAHRIGAELVMNHPAELDVGVVMPIQAYPLFEQARRHRLGRSIDEHMVAVSELWARFSAVAAGNPHAWRRDALSAEAIRTPTADNRYVGYPYTKAMNSYENVDQSAGVLLCAAEKAEALGVPRDRWVFVHGGADAQEHPEMSFRADLHTSPAIGVAGRALFDALGTGPDELDHLDLYSCFPAAPQFGAEELGIDESRQLTQTGGLAFAGGPWNNYSMHAIATMAGTLRGDPGSRGFVWANGGHFTKHSMGIYSTEPPARVPFTHVAPQDRIDALPRTELVADHVGPATIESWVVMHDAGNAPEIAYAALRTSDGARCWARTADPAALADLVDGEQIGRSVERRADQTFVL